MNVPDYTFYLIAILPALIVGAVAFYFFHTYMKNEEARRRFLLHKENQKAALPLKLQAYERLALYLERIAPGKLFFRIKPTSEEANLYADLIIANIEQEFEHNLAQQIYISGECWDYIKTAKNATIAMIRKVAVSENVNTANDLRETMLKSLMEKQTPSEAALGFIKKEVRNLT